MEAIYLKLKLKPIKMIELKGEQDFTKELREAFL